MKQQGERGFTLLEVVLSMVAIALFLLLAIDPVLSFQKQKNQLMIETHRLDKMASDQVAERRDGYQIREGTWCIEELCLASSIRNDTPRNLVGPLAEPVATD
ncbi:prepilin-type N-terminal cleavage/methylation domain-containing protein [Exiguobacterium sp. KRL4]|uniref:type II secretion system protein n=1 Tax=Exiguobacterium sp. KRL4 TaxID=1914536 RepID=UPI0008F8C95D|nr:type II secretion system protein [Exiguobacterium sp. KRL4]OIN68465.1 prepilin-type N-terminal cleavage/methylation domain-containing protein [Exiguobacterium sp. KRL4]